MERKRRKRQRRKQNKRERQRQEADKIPELHKKNQQPEKNQELRRSVRIRKAKQKEEEEEVERIRLGLPKIVKLKVSSVVYDMIAIAWQDRTDTKKPPHLGRRARRRNNRLHGILVDQLANLSIENDEMELDMKENKPEAKFRNFQSRPWDTNTTEPEQTGEVQVDAAMIDMFN